MLWAKKNSKNEINYVFWLVNQKMARQYYYTQGFSRPHKQKFTDKNQKHHHPFNWVKNDDAVWVKNYDSKNQQPMKPVVENVYYRYMKMMKHIDERIAEMKANLKKYIVLHGMSDFDFGPLNPIDYGNRQSGRKQSHKMRTRQSKHKHRSNNYNYVLK